MPLKDYGVLVGRVADRKIEAGNDSPHYQVHVVAGGIAYRIAVNVRSAQSPPDLLYIADEAFFTGTAAEVTPIRELDRRVIGSGSRGPVTEKIQKAFFDVVNGRNKKYHHWLTPVK